MKAKSNKNGKKKKRQVTIDVTDEEESVSSDKTGSDTEIEETQEDLE